VIHGLLQFGNPCLVALAFGFLLFFFELFLGVSRFRRLALKESAALLNKCFGDLERRLDFLLVKDRLQCVAAVLLAVHVALEIGQRSLSIRVTDGQHAAADAAVGGAAIAVAGLHSHRRSGAEAPVAGQGTARRLLGAGLGVALLVGAHPAATG